MFKLKISLVTWNGGKYLTRCFESLLSQTFQDFSLTVLDNGSTDDTVAVINKYADKFSGRFELIIKPENLGFAKGHNLVMSANKSPYIFVLNQDIYLEPDYLAKCVEFLDAHPNVGAVSGKILKWNFEPGEPGQAFLKKSEKSNIIDSLGLQIFRSGRVIERMVGQIDNEEFNQTHEVFGVSGTVPIYRQSALESVKFENEYFDEDFFSYKEDVDLSFRLRLAGWQIWVVANALAYHDRTASANENLTLGEKFAHRRKKSKLVNYNSYKNQWYLLVKNFSWANLFINLPWILGYELKKFLYALIFERSTLKSTAEFYRKFPRMKRKRLAIMSGAKILDQEIRKWLV